MKAEKPRPIPLAEKIKDLRGIDSRKATRTFEWCCEWASYWLSRWAFLEVLEYVGKLGILLAVVAYLYPGCEERKQATDCLLYTSHQFDRDKDFERSYDGGNLFHQHRQKWKLFD